MVSLGDEGLTPRQRTSQLTAGLGLLENVIVDQHFDQRGRYGRLMSLVANSPNLIGMGIDENPPKEDDEVVDVNGMRVYVDSYSAQYLEGAEIDYVDAIMGGGFTINNPNAVKTCGCGHSFQTADSAGEAKACSH